MHGMTLGSLFDGSGSFPVAGLLSGIKPVWKSEIEPFPIAVTNKRLPQMKHYGDIRTINGAEIEPVDIITFGSPCTDLSIAGKRAGLNAERSGLFFQAVRVIKEMRVATNGKYPRFIVWENVTGAFSSQSGEDFRTVLEEICKIKDSTVSVPRPEKWSKAGEIVADGFSLAWRTLDAQYWGVPQRRKRIYLVADFAGGSAGK
ncbi:MAG: DNA cytosine methyltransferase, partial [Ruminococcus sp.]|nr:DNA cytosine methyltransferase [Ruminococcus sp.]